MDLWYERPELAEEHRKDLLREARNWDLIRETLQSDSKLTHPAAHLFSQINQWVNELRPNPHTKHTLHRDTSRQKDEYHVDQLA